MYSRVCYTKRTHTRTRTLRLRRLRAGGQNLRSTVRTIILMINIDTSNGAAFSPSAQQNRQPTRPPGHLASVLGRVITACRRRRRRRSRNRLIHALAQCILWRNYRVLASAFCTARVLRQKVLRICIDIIIIDAVIDAAIDKPPFLPPLPAVSRR